MDAYQRAQHAHNRTSDLTQLYSDVKKSAETNLGANSPATQQFTALQRKYRIQRDRLITWGLAWSDDEKGVDGNIDDSVARAGLTETVDSVLRNIKEVTEEAERIRLGGYSPLGGDSKLPLKPVTFDENRYEDLLKDLTTSIDILYDLSQNRRALARGEHPSFDNDPRSFEIIGDEKGKKVPPRSYSPVESVRTLVNPPPFLRPSLSPYSGLPPRIDAAALHLPQEPPPSYDNMGIPSTTRLVARLIRARASESIQNTLGSAAAEVPVMIEYANFDSIYRDTHVPPPLQRLEALAAYLQPMRPESQTGLSLLGYFEDPTQPRLGLVYDVPYMIQNKLLGIAGRPAQSLNPTSLLKIVQKSRKNQLPSEEHSAPALESRYQLALRLTEQLYEFHLRSLPHGNVNSGSVIFTMTGGEGPLLHTHMRSPLWSAFDLFSKCSVEGATRDNTFNIYRHPSDMPQSTERGIDMDIKYDLYGLALVLLEIGLWIPIGELYKAKYTIADFKLRIERLWIPKLASKCGSAYMRVVQACLRIADEPQGTKVDTPAVYDHLTERLRRCCLLDEDDQATEPLIPSEFQSFQSHENLRSPPSISTLAPSVTSRMTSIPESTIEQQRIPPRQAVPRKQVPVSAIAAQATRDIRAFTTAPSLKDFKTKVVLIQRTWRAYRERTRLYQGFQSPQGLPQGLGLRPKTGQDQRVGPKRKEFPSLQLPQEMIDDWHNKLGLQLADLVERALKGSRESSSIALTAYGETPETARPTFLVCCKSTAKVKQVLKRHFKYDHDIYDVKVKKDEIRRCRKSRRRGGKDVPIRSMAPASALDRAANPEYQERPICGASIGAYRDDEHLPPVSFGGIIMVDGMPYGMSVHHMLEPNDDDEDDTVPGAAADDEDEDSDTSSIRSSDDISVWSHSEDDSTVRLPSIVPADDEPVDGHQGDMPGITPDDFEEIPITQPALDDAIDCDLHVDEGDDDDDEDSGIDEDHLLSYKLGQVHASSGLKRTARSRNQREGGFKSISQSLPQEIDWALFELIPPRIQPYNIIKGGSKHCTSSASSFGGDSCPTSIRSSESLPCAKVHCLGRTSGLGSGTVSSAMELVKIHGRSTFSASWTVDGNFGVGGDSGAWVISNEDGSVCGHVLASRKGRTYICPMDLLLEDIRVTLGAKKVELPPAVMMQQRPQTQGNVPTKGLGRISEALQRKMKLGSAASTAGEDVGGSPKGGGVTLPVSPPESPKTRAVKPRGFTGASAAAA